MFLPKFEFLFLEFGEGQWIWIMLVIIILFGGKKLPELAKGLGKGIREFKNAKDGIQQEIENGISKDGDSTSQSPKAIQGGQQRVQSGAQQETVATKSNS